MIPRSWKGILLAVSLCLNAGFLTAYGVHWYGHSHRPQPGRDMALPADVRARVEANYKAFRRELLPMESQLAAQRTKLLDLLASDQPSPQAIADQQARIVAVQGQIVQMLTRHLLEQKRLLTPEQQRQFFDHIRRRVQEHDHRPPLSNEEKHK